MYRPRIIPCLLLHDLGLVKTVGFQHPNYIGDALNAVKIFNEYETDELIFMDIEATRKNTVIDIEFVKKVSEEAYMPFAVGGGISSQQQAESYVKAGAEKIILNSAVYGNYELLENISNSIGNQSLVVAVDVKKENGKYSLFSHSGTKHQDISLHDHITHAVKHGAGEIFITAIDREGAYLGYDIELINLVQNLTNVPVIACGGATSMDDMSKVYKQTQVSALAAGSIFVYIGKNKAVLINYPDKEELFELFAEA